MNNVPATQAPDLDTPLDRLRTRVLTDDSLRQTLQACDDPERFAALVAQVAAGIGLGIGPDAVRGAMRLRLPGMDDFAGAEIRETPLPPADWLPIGASWRADQLYVRWCHFGEVPLRDPFFEGSVQRRMPKPFNRLFQAWTPITRLADWLEIHPGLGPSGFIFHMSRCGSTLVSQMLAALERNVVVSEASPIDAVVRAPFERPDLAAEEHAQWLSWIVGALGHPRRGETHYFVKLDCWHTLALPLFRRAFPNVPWVFLYRDPVEVLVSQARMPGMHMVPGMLGHDVFGLLNTGAAGNPEEHHARVLARVCAPVLEHCDEQAALLVNYRELPQAVWTKIMPHFGISCGDNDRAVMAAAARFDAKTPSFEFTADSAAKQAEASPTLRDAAARWLDDPYRRLERRAGGLRL